MRNWLLGIVTGLILAFLGLVLIVIIAIKVPSLPPRVKSPTTVVLDLKGEIVEVNPTDLPARLLQGGLKATLRYVDETLEKAAADQRVVAVVVRLRSPEIGWAKADELRSALARFRSSRKKLYCYMISGSLRDYFIATACDQVIMQPVGLLEVKGMRAESLFLKGTLDKLGVQAELVHTGAYKTYSNTFTQKAMTPEHREMVNWLVDSLYGTALKTISEARKKPVEQVRAIIEAGPYPAPAARQAGLIDQLLYEDQVYDLIKNADPGRQFNKMSARQYAEVPASDAGLQSGPKIGVVYAVGDIASGDGGTDPLSGEQNMTAENMTRLLGQARDDASLKAVILRIDSPGGDALASDAIWRAVNDLHTRKPLVISMSDVAGSGGYYIAASGDPIVAGAGTLTASIGVVHGKINIHGLYDKLGITKDGVTRGPNSTLDSDYVPYTPQQWQIVGRLADDMYKVFKGKVAAARKMKIEDVERLAGGRVFTGEQAKRKGLVDELGGLRRAVELAKQKAGIPAGRRVELVVFPHPRSLFEIIMERGQSAEVRLPALPVAPVPEALRLLSAARILNSGRPAALMPFRFAFY
jgi:protease-4